MFEKLRQFLNEVSREMRKVSWPSREEVWESTQVVIAICLVITAFIGLLDWLISTLVAGLFA